MTPFNIFSSVCILLLIGISFSFATDAAKDPLTEKAEALLSKLTPDEKVDIVVGPGMSFDGAPVPVINLQKNVAGVAGYINGVVNLNIPALKVADGPAGLRINPSGTDSSNNFYATAFPIETMIASAWDKDMCQLIGTAIGEEIKEYGVDFWLAPALNIQRNPLCGRNFEYYSEDPFLTGKITANLVKGVESKNVGTTIKHFFANNSETNRMQVDTIATERALREIYLRGFEIAVREAQPWAVMTSYNRVNGIYTSESKDLIANILRGEWGFKGMVMTDWLAGSDNAAQMRAGNDLVMPGGTSSDSDYSPKKKIISALKAGTLDIADVDRNVINILKKVLISPTYNGYAYSNKPDLKAHAAISKKAATEGMVLLKNNRALPFHPNSKIASFGVGQILTVKGGTGSGDVHPSYIVNITDGLKKIFTVDPDLGAYYRSYVEKNKILVSSVFGSYYTCEESALTGEEIARHAGKNDAVITISRISGEGSDRKNVAGDYLLNEKEITLINNVSTAFHNAKRKVAVVLNIGGPVEIASWEDKVDAILLAWQPGQEAGDAVAEVLSGKVNPSGKLAQTFPVKYSDVPSSSTFPGNDPVNPAKIYYNDDIYVGYRYYSTFDIAPLYEFGYGLSYTSFKYSDVKFIGDNRNHNNSYFCVMRNVQDNIKLSVKVMNTGHMEGREVAQVYVSSPDVTLQKPKIELKDFAKTKLLRPGKVQELNFCITPENLASYDSANGQWIVEAGEYKVYITPSSDIKHITPLIFRVDEKIIVSNATLNALAPKEEIPGIISK